MEEHEDKMTHIISLKNIFFSAPTTSSEIKTLVKTESKELEVLRRCLVALEINVWRINTVNWEIFMLKIFVSKIFMLKYFRTDKECTKIF